MLIGPPSVSSVSSVFSNPSRESGSDKIKIGVKKNRKNRKNCMTVVIDSREQCPWLFHGYGVETVREGLPSGDYSVEGYQDRIALERKSLDDLVGSFSAGRDRFEREMVRLSALEFSAVIVEASAEDVVRHRYKSRMHPNAVLQTCFSWTVRHGIPFLFCGSRRHAEYVCHGLLQKFVRAQEEAVHG